MEIKELLEKKKEVEFKIAEALVPIFIEFRKETGFSLRDIAVNMIEVTSFADPHPRYLLSQVKVDLAIRGL